MSAAPLVQLAARGDDIFDAVVLPGRIPELVVAWGFEGHMGPDVPGTGALRRHMYPCQRACKFARMHAFIQTCVPAGTHACAHTRIQSTLKRASHTLTALV